MSDKYDVMDLELMIKAALSVDALLKAGELVNLLEGLSYEEKERLRKIYYKRRQELVSKGGAIEPEERFKEVDKYFGPVTYHCYRRPE